jgi:hypothetical protein
MNIKDIFSKDKLLNKASESLKKELTKNFTKSISEAYKEKRIVFRDDGLVEYTENKTKKLHVGSLSSIAEIIFNRNLSVQYNMAVILQSGFTVFDVEDIIIKIKSGETK